LNESRASVWRGRIIKTGIVYQICDRRKQQEVSDFDL
jgi:hypothetical protein